MTPAPDTRSAAIDEPAPPGRSPRDVPGGAPLVTADVLGSFDAGGLTASAWNGLLERSGGSVYNTYEWQTAWWECFGGGRDLHLIRFTSDGEIVGIAPFFAERESGSRGARLRLIGSGDAFTKSRGVFSDDGPGDYLDMLVDPGFAEQIADAFSRLLAANDRSIGRIDLVNLREDGAFMTLIGPRLASGRFAPRVRGSERCPFIEVSGDALSFIRALDSGARRRYGQAFRLVQSPEAPLRLDMVTGAPGRVFADLVRLHQERWNRMGYPGLFSDEQHVRFQEMVADRFARQGWLWLASLYDGESCVAARLGFVFRDRMYDYLSGFDESSPAARRRPGLGLLLAMYDAAAGRGLRTLDLLRGDEAYKFELTDRVMRIFNATIDVAPAPGPVARAVGAVGSALEFGGFIAKREFRLYRVQARHHGIIRSAGKYLEFRTSRLRKRMKSGTAGNDSRTIKGDPAA